MINKIKKSSQTGFSLPLWFACLIFVFFSATVQADNSVWFSDLQNVYQFKPSNQEFSEAIPVGDIRELAADGKGGLWLASGSQLRYYSGTGNILRQWDIGPLGLSTVRQMRADPYDASVWLTDGARVLHLSTEGDILANFYSYVPVHDIALAADQSVWLADASEQLWHYDSRGKPIRSIRLPESMRAAPNHLVIDSLRAKMWLWNANQIVQVDLNTDMSQRSFSTPDNSISAALDQRTGTLWMLSNTALTALSASGFPITTDLSKFKIVNPRALAYDTANNSLWIGHVNGLSRLDFSRDDPAMLLAATPAKIIAAAPFVISPSIALLEPKSNYIGPSVNQSIVLGASARCHESACALPSDYLSGYRIDAMLDGKDVGDRFVFEASNNAFRFVPTLTAKGASVFRAQAFDIFGHGSNIIEETFDFGITRSGDADKNDNALVAGAPSLVVAKGPARAAAHAPPTVSITSPVNNASVVEPATIAIRASAAATGATITKVSFYKGTTLLGTSTVSPYVYNWTNVAAGSYTLTAKATDSLGASTTSSAIKITVTHAPPTVSITSPVNNASIAGPATIAIKASAAATGATISKVSFYNGTTLLGTSTVSPYAYNWTNVAAGSYTLTAKATDSLGASTTSSAIKVTVTRAPPTVSITSPVSNARFLPAATVAISATASASNATISKVQFYQGSTLLGTDTTAPYSFNWSNVPQGTYSLTAKATDSLGAVSTSAAVPITVAPPPPVVNITSPINNAVVALPMTITATASSTGGAINVVNFYNGAALIGSVSEAPYTFRWTNLAPGSYTLTAVAIDSNGLSTTSPAIRVTAVAPPAITLSSPQSNTNLLAPAAISVSATASSPNGTITKVEFFNGSTLLRTATTPPYTAALSNLPSGNYLITAKATDSAGYSAVSPGLFFAVDATDTCVSDAPIAANGSGTAHASLALAQRPLSFEANQGQSPAEVKFQVRRPGYDLFLTSDKAVLDMHGMRGIDGKPDAYAQAHALHMRFLGANPHAVLSGLDLLQEKTHYLNGSDPAQWRRDVPHFAKVKYTDLYPGVDSIYYGKDGQVEYDLIVAPGADPRSIRFTLDGAETVMQNENGDLQLHTPQGLLIKQKPVAWQDIDGVRHPVDASYAMLAAYSGTATSPVVTIEVGDYDAHHPLVIDPMLVYSTYLGGGATDQVPHAATVDRCGNLVVVGQTSVANFPVTAGAIGATNPSGNNSGFIAKFNAQGTALLYSTYIGGTNSSVNGVALDSAGHAFVAGKTSGNGPITPGSFQTTSSAPSTSFVAKLSTDGRALLYGTYLGGNNLGTGTYPVQEANSIAVDALGNAYVTGTTSAYDFPVTPGVFQPAYRYSGGYADPSNAFVTKLNPVGTALLYSTYLGWDTSRGKNISVDGGGNAFIAGETRSNFPTTAGAYQEAPMNYTGTSLTNGFVAKLNPAGSALGYSTFVSLAGVPGTTTLNGMTTDDSGSVYVTGSHRVDTYSSSKAYVLKLNSSGSNRVFLSSFGGSTCPTCYPVENIGQAIVLDRAGNLLVTGTTTAANFPLVKPVAEFPTVLPVSGIYGQGAFLTKLEPSGVGKHYSTFLAGNPGKTSDITSGLALAVDADGDAYVAGTTTATDFPTTPGAFQSTSGGATSMFVAKISDPVTRLLVQSNGGAWRPAILTATISGGKPNPTGTVSFYDGTTLLGTVAVSAGSATLTTQPLALGEHPLKAVYSGDSTHVSTTSDIWTLALVNLPPAVTITAPADGASFVAGTPIALAATADPQRDVTVYRVNFFADTPPYHGFPPQIGSTEVRPYSFTWNNAPPGSYKLTASALDSNGLTGWSGETNITITPPPNGVPMAPALTGAYPVDEGAQLHYTAPLYIGGSALTRYNAICTATGSPTVSMGFTPDTYPVVMGGMTGGVTYLCTMTASNTQGTSILSNAVSVTPTASPYPSAIITGPADNSTVSTNNPVTISVNAISYVSTIATIEIFDNGALLTSYTPPGAFGSFAFNYSWVNPTVGSHRLAVRVTDANGTSIISDRTVNAVVGPSVTLALDAGTYVAPSTVALTATPVAASGSTISKVDFYHASTLLGTVSSAPYTFRWTGVGAGTYPVSAVATDSQGVTATATATATVLAGPAVTLDGGQDGSTVNDDHVTVTGQVQTSLNSAVDINGQAGTIAADGRFFVRNVPLMPGSNPLTLTVTTADGATAVKTLNVTGSGPALFRFHADTDHGLAPLNVGFSLTQQGDLGTVAVTRIDWLCLDGGGVSATTTSLTAAHAECSYTSTGLYRIRVNVYGKAPDQAEQLIYSGTQDVNVMSVRYLDGMLRGMYQGMLDRLKAGNVAGALNAVTPESRDRYSAIFSNLGSDLSTVVDQLGTLKQGTLNEGFAQYIVIRNGAQGPEAYAIQVIPGEDGIWRIEGM